MRVAELAASLAVTTDTVRFYTRKGLLAPARDPHNGYKGYDASQRARLRFILNARQLGFSVADISALLAQADRGQSPCATARSLLETRLRETEQRFQEAVALRANMRAALAAWAAQPDRPPTGQMICHLIENLGAFEHPAPLAHEESPQ